MRMDAPRQNGVRRTLHVKHAASYGGYPPAPGIKGEHCAYVGRSAPYVRIDA